MDTMDLIRDEPTRWANTICSASELRTYARDFPNAPVTLYLRNFNDPARLTLVAIEVPGHPNPFRPSAARCDPTQLFPTLNEWCEEHRGGFVPIAKFVADGQRLASLIGREVHIIHEWGSGPQTKSYGPYRP